MTGNCKDCAKEKTCTKTCGAMFGFCHTDFEQKPLKLKVNYEDGDFNITTFNGTLEEAKKYYVGNTFNLGDGEDDYTVECTSIEVLEN